MVIFMLRTRVTLYYPATEAEPGDLASDSVSRRPTDGNAISWPGHNLPRSVSELYWRRIGLIYRWQPAHGSHMRHVLHPVFPVISQRMRATSLVLLFLQTYYILRLLSVK